MVRMGGDSVLPVTAGPERRGFSGTAVADIAFCVVLGLAHLGLTSWLRPPGVGTFDMAIAMDGGYRVWCGQLPYRDFHIPTGPVRHYAMALCFLVTGGFSWSAAILGAGLIGSTAAVLVYYVLRTCCGRLHAVLIATLTVLTFNLPAAFPWFDHLAFLWVLVSLTAVVAVQAATSERRIALGAIASGVALTLAVMTKQNIGGAALVPVVLVWLAVPLPGRTFPANCRAAAWCAGAAGLSAVALIAFFEWHGDFLHDFFRAGSQVNRLQSGLALLGANLLAGPQATTLDVWMLFGMVPYLLVVRLCGVQLTPHRRTLVLLAGACLMVTTIGRCTGSAPQAWFSALVPLALGLLAGLVRGPDPGHVTVPVPALVARALAVPAAMAVIWCGTAALVVMQWSRLGWELDLTRADFDSSYDGIFNLALALFFLVHAVRLVAAGRGVRLGLPSVARTLLLFAAAMLAAYFVVYDVQRLGWSFTPACRGPAVPFTKIPALAGCEGRPEQVADFEELYEWWQSQRSRYPRWRDGQDLYILPTSQQFYGILGVESFRNVRLWYDPNLTYLGKDPDTDQVEAALPALIIMPRDGRPYQFMFWTTASFLREVPRLQRLLRERFEVVATLQGFTIWGRKE
jgi:hypothetical protein